VCRRRRTLRTISRPGLTAATSAPGLGSPLPQSAPGLGSPLPHLHRDFRELAGTGLNGAPLRQRTGARRASALETHAAAPEQRGQACGAVEPRCYEDLAVPKGTVRHREYSR
jgi:hypothetical protein